jgi:pyruvate dehydrogenase E1 component alpha subunit
MTSAAPNQELQLDLLRRMYRIRFFEEKSTEIRKINVDIVGSIHMCTGQEAIYAGTLSALTHDDRVFGTYRGRGWALMCGVPPEKLFGELMGREIGVCQGRAGPALLSAADWNFLGENSIIGAGAPIACGAALSAKTEGKGRVVITALGDGAMNQGGVHEAMNFAAYLDLPLIFICENNTYSELTPTIDMVRSGEFYKRAAAYGMPGVRVDGNDPEAMRATVSEYAAAARAGKGPALIEATTQRLVGHYYGDMQSYRPKGEITEAKKAEPIVRLRAKMEAAGVPTSTLDAIAAEAQAEMERAAELALQAPRTDPSTVKEHIYA